MGGYESWCLNIFKMFMPKQSRKEAFYHLFIYAQKYDWHTDTKLKAIKIIDEHYKGSLIKNTYVYRKRK